ncbi:MAG: hypothetical protein Q7R35_20235 [Elusimicrobiota bacterium]|nr:hypothetical protein [Elusimicrobiota bacterium]
MKTILTLAVAVLFSAGKAGYAAPALDALKAAAPAGETEVMVPAVPAIAPLGAALRERAAQAPGDSRESARNAKDSRGATPAAGNYLGATSRGKLCGVKIEKQYENVYLQIYWVEQSGKYRSCGFFPKKSGGSGNFVEMSGGSEFSVCKSGLTLNNTGVPVEAKLGIGSLLQFGYNETCSNLAVSSLNKAGREGLETAEIRFPKGPVPASGQSALISKEGRGAAALNGTILLEGNSLPVSITYRTFPADQRINVGPMVFVLTGQGQSFAGFRNAGGAEQNVLIAPAGAGALKDPQQMAEELGIANFKEIKCCKGDHFLMLADKLTGKIVANCVQLR